jgi:hypothetical protein
MANTLRYPSEEPIQANDRVTYMGEPGTVEFVATSGVPGYEWFVEEYPPHGGVMLLLPSFGRLFISDPAEYERLAFVSRAPEGEQT